MLRLIILITWTISGCTAADSIQLGQAADGGALNIQWPSETSDESGGNDAQSTGINGGTATADQSCDGGVCNPASDCTGSNCPEGNTDGIATDIPCSHNVDCLAPGTLCPGPNSLCVDTSQPASCGSTSCSGSQVCRDCPLSPTECADALSCSSDERVCMNLHGASCSNSCDCADALICDITNQRCVQCLTTEAHCTILNVEESDQLETCNSAGVCSPVVELSIAELDVIRSLIVQEILLQVKDLTGTTARALITFEQTVPFTSGGETITAVSPEVVFTEDRCSVINENLDVASMSFSDEEKERVRAVFGCTSNGSQTNRFVWNDSLNTPGLGQIGCLMYRPRMPSRDGNCHRWRIWLGPCESAWTATLEDSVCSNVDNTESDPAIDAGVPDP